MHILSSSVMGIAGGGERPHLQGLVEQLVLAAVPEFFGALAASVVIAATTWAWRRLRHQAPPPPDPGAPSEALDMGDADRDVRILPGGQALADQRAAG